MLKHRVLVVFFALMLSGISHAQPITEAETQARAALDLFLEGWNSGDGQQIREAVNFPAVSHGPDGITIDTSPETFAVPYERIRAQGWASSRWDTITTYFVSDEKVNFGVEFSRLNEAGEVYVEGYVIYVFTNRDGHWGMQYRAGDLDTDRYDPADLAAARRDAIAAIDEFFQAFNAMDNEALLQLHHVPQALITDNNGFVLADDASSRIVTTDFEGMQSRENWARSQYEDVRILAITPTRVIVELIFERIDTEGNVYRRVPALWVLAQHEGRWGMKFRSLMASAIE